MRIIPVIGALIGFLIVICLTPWIIRFLKKMGLVVKDQNKENKPLIPVSGGLVVVGGLIAGLMSYVFIQTFFYKDTSNLLIIFASTISLLLVTLIGFMDDLLIGKDREATTGLKQWQKPLLTVIGAIPLMVVNAGTSTMWIPFFGEVKFGLIYPLLFVPIIFVGASNMVNMLAGFNGLETGLGLIYLGNLGLFAYVNDRMDAALIAAVAFACMLGFFYYNKFPAKIFPGDSLTYLLGGTLAVIAIIGNIEKAALIMSIPFFIEFILKARGRFKNQSYGTYSNGKVKSLYNKIYSIPHFFTITGKFTEGQVVYLTMLIELVFAGLVWVV
ncbi:hypothetical protein J4413_00260 [Candidatus Woesearchaeota archaeon]|nr:hypothetical protein [Candidatus Woesearchaeota archaeon]